MDWFQLRLFFMLCLTMISGCASGPVQSTPPEQKKATPQRLVLIVFDGLGVDSIERFHLSHLENFQAHSQNYPNAFLGYVGSEPVVSHMVIAAGKKPKELPIQDEIFYDIEGKLGDKEKFYITSDLTREQLQVLEEQDIDENVLLPAEFKDRFGGKVYAVGDPQYAAVELGTHMSDSVITLKRENGRCVPDGINVPRRVLSSPKLSTNCPKGGLPDADTWVADVALNILKHEDWNGLLLSFPGIKQGLQSSNPDDLEKSMKLADEQLGRILDAIDERGLKKETLVVVTSGHGAQENLHRLPKFAKNENVLFSYQDTAIRVWMKDRNLNRDSLIQQLKQTPGVTEIYALQRDKNNWFYQQVHSDVIRQSKAFIQWAEKRSREIADAAATVNSPDLIAFLADQFGSGTRRYGGAQESIQRVPFMIYNPKIEPFKYYQAIRAFEFKGEIFRQFSR